jgi:hypothetical protein
MSSSKEKKNSSKHERGSSSSKPSSSSSHKKHHSRDSAIGSSITTASDRASVGTAVEDEVFTRTTIEEQRYNLNSVQEALDAAYVKIKALEKKNEKLNDELSDSHKEIRTLKKERSGYLKEQQDLIRIIDDLNAKLDKEPSPRSKAASMARPSSSSAETKERKPSPTIRNRPAEPTRPRHQEILYDHPAPLPSPRQPSSMSSSQQRQQPLITNHERRSSLYDRQTLPTVPQAPVNHHPNPFLPRTTPAVTYSPAMALPHTTSYTPSNVSYTTAPMGVPTYAISTTSSGGSGSGSGGRRRKDDGRYHLEPL